MPRRDPAETGFFITQVFDAEWNLIGETAEVEPPQPCPDTTKQVTSMDVAASPAKESPR